MKQKLKRQLLEIHDEAQAAVTEKKLFQQSGELAAYHALLAFEERCHLARRISGQPVLVFPSGAPVETGKWSVDWLLKNVTPRGVEVEDVTYSDATLGWAREALDAIEWFRPIDTATLDVLAGRKKVRLRRGSVVFSDSPGEEGFDAFSRVLRDAEDQNSVLASHVLGLISEFDPSEIERVILETSDSSGDELLYSESALVTAFAASEGRVAATVSRSVSGDATCGSYTLADARSAWLAIWTRARIHDLYCLYNFHRNDRIVRSLILRTTDEELVALLATAGLDQSAAKAFISDFSCSPGSLGSGYIHERPLVHIGDEYFISPTLFTSANTEECILRTWSKRHSGAYGSEVARRKKAIEAEWASRFRAAGWKATHGRKLRRADRSTAGDVDVCAYDPGTGHLAIFQLKWILSPDVPREVSTAEQHLEDAARQAREALVHLERSADPLKLLFGSAVQDEWEVTGISVAVLGRGYSLLNASRARGVTIVAEPLAATVVEAHNTPLDQLVPRFANLMREPWSIGAWKQYRVITSLGNRKLIATAFSLAHEQALANWLSENLRTRS